MGDPTIGLLNKYVWPGLKSNITRGESSMAWVNLNGTMVDMDEVVSYSIEDTRLEVALRRGMVLRVEYSAVNKGNEDAAKDVEAAFAAMSETIEKHG